MEGGGRGRTGEGKNGRDEQVGGEGRTGEGGTGWREEEEWGREEQVGGRGEKVKGNGKKEIYGILHCHVNLHVVQGQAS